MLHHASRLVPTTNFINSSLAEILQAAAGRAWVRCVNTNSTSDRDGEPNAKGRVLRRPSRVLPPHAKQATRDDSQESSSFSPPRLSFRAHMAKSSWEHDRIEAWKFGFHYQDKSFWHKPSLPHPGKRKDAGVVPILSECPSEDDILSIDPGRDTDASPEIDLPSDVLTTVNPGPIETITPSPLRLPSSRNSLYQNMLALLSRPGGPVDLQALVSYYLRSHSHAFRSTRSFNLLISLAIRHASFNTAELLLSQMKTQGIGDNLETWKLRVRLMVRRGEWDNAWVSVMSTLRTQGWTEQMGIRSEHEDGMPLAIWTEFMSTIKRGTISASTAFEIRGRNKSYKGEEEEEVTAEPNEVEKAETLRALDSQRLELLMKHPPSLTPKERERIPARTVYFIVWMMLRVGHFADARNMTRSYIVGLPPKLDATTLRASLDIIHLHIIWASRKRSPLHQHYNMRRGVESLFAAHQNIKPNARTLFLLLGSLRRTTHSGTLARQVANAFCRKWGYSVISRRVRQRIATFAVNEGNADLADIELRKEKQSRFQEWTYAARTEVLGCSGRPGYFRLLRPPMRKIYKESGVVTRRWRHLAWKVRQMKTAKAEKQRVEV